jgi:hypothetical protein
MSTAVPFVTVNYASKASKQLEKLFDLYTKMTSKKGMV